jgi:hypothetical protein
MIYKDAGKNNDRMYPAYSEIKRGVSVTVVIYRVSQNYVNT